eukprot:m.209458 g.209458  ORF g.209458 m.209458 type:complete len:153 (+) comp25461_c1_seq6:636-1094(+)
MVKFAQFCTIHSLFIVTDSYVVGLTGSVLFPDITPSLLCFYLAWLHREGHQTYASMMAYITAVCSWCSIEGRPNPRLDPTYGGTNASFFAVCRGLRRSIGDPPVTRFPVTEWHLRILHQGAHRLLHPLQRANFVASTRLAFAAMLRVSEFTT